MFYIEPEKCGCCGYEFDVGEAYYEDPEYGVLCDHCFEIVSWGRRKETHGYDDALS